MYKYSFSLFFILLVSCNTQKNAVNLPQPCEKYYSYYDTLQSFIKDLRVGNDYFLVRGDTKSLIRDFYFVNNHQKWDWLPYPLDHNKKEIKDNIKCLIDTLNKIQCDNLRSLEFAFQTIKQIEHDEKRYELSRQEEIKKGNDLDLSGIKIFSHKISYTEEINPIMEIEISNETEVTTKSIEVYVKFCDITISLKSQKLDPKCFQLVLLKKAIQPFTKNKYSFPLDKNKIENRSAELEVGISRIVKNDGEMIEKFESAYYF